MPNQALIEGIKQHIKNGDTKETIRQLVIEAGYSEQEFLDSYNSAAQYAGSFQNPAPLVPTTYSETIAISTPPTPSTGNEQSAWPVKFIIKLALGVLVGFSLLILLFYFFIGFRMGLEETREAGANEAVIQTVTNATFMAEIYGIENNSYEGFCSSNAYRALKSDFTTAANLNCVDSPYSYIVELQLPNQNYYCADGSYLGELVISSIEAGYCQVDKGRVANACTIDSPEVRQARDRIAQLEIQMTDLHNQKMQVLEDDIKSAFEGDALEYELGPNEGGQASINSQLQELSQEYNAEVLGLHKRTKGQFSLRDIYQQYCSTDVELTGEESIDASGGTLKELSGLLFGEVACELETDLVPAQKIPESLARLGSLAIMTGEVRLGHELTTCAAERYYSPSAMLDLSRLYSYGSETYYPEDTAGEQFAIIQPDNETAYYWIVAHLITANLVDSPYADQGLTQLGWNSQARYDQLQNGSGLNLLEMREAEERAINFLSKRFTELSAEIVDKDISDDVTTMEVTEYIDGEPVTEVTEIPAGVGVVPGYSYEDQLAQKRVYNLAVFAAMQGYETGTYAGICEDEYEWTGIELYAGVKNENTFCNENGSNFVIYAPLTTGEYYCVDVFDLHEIISTTPKEYSCF